MAAILFLVSVPLLGQTGALTLASGSATQGGVVPLNLTWSPSNVNAAGVQWTLTYPTQSVTGVSVSAGAVATAAGKSITCNYTSGSAICLAVGNTNATTIAGGVVAVVTVTLTANASSAVNISVGSTFGVLGDGTAATVTGSGGTIAVQSAPPSAVSVTPNSGSGSSQTFAFLYSDAKGFAAIGSAQIVINASLTSVAGCYILYNRASNAASLVNDAGSAWLGPVTLGQTGTLQNNQCSLNAAGSSFSGSGSNLTLNLALTFKPAFHGTQNIYMDVADSTADSGWIQRGTWTVPSSGSPSPVSVTPASGTGASQTFAFVFSDPNGFAGISSTQVLFNGSLSGAAGCYLMFNRAANTVNLVNDAGTAWLTAVTLGQAGTLQNSQCSVSAAGSSSSGSGTNLTLNLALSFQSTFVGAKNVYMEAFDSPVDSGWIQRGAWTVPSSGTPTTVSVTPSSGTGSTQTFNLVYSDPNGYATITSTQVIFNSGLTAATGCYLFYARASNLVYLANDAGTTWLSPVTLGQTGTLQNSQCSVNVAGSSASGSGNNLTLNLALTFLPAFHGAKNSYMEVSDSLGGDSGWQQRGSWTVPSNGVPGAVSVTPSSGSGSSQTFTLVYSDANGYTALNLVQVVINNGLTSAAGCYLLYSPSTNTALLANDSGTAWLPAVTLGQAGTLQNSQCTVNVAGSSVSGVGNNLTLNLALTFSSSFRGAKSIYMDAMDSPGDSGWQQLGTWTVQ